MPALAKTHVVIAPDFRGYGQSEKPEHGYEVQTMVEDLRQLLDQLGRKSVDIVGHDLGGIVAYLCRQAWRPSFSTRNYRGSDSRGSIAHDAGSARELLAHRLLCPPATA